MKRGIRHGTHHHHRSERRAGGDEACEPSGGRSGAGRNPHRAEGGGANFIDVYQRSGLYKLPLPTALGMEAAGVVEAVGEGVTHLKPGDRAAYATAPAGAYTEARVMPAAQVCKLPDAIFLRGRGGDDAEGADGRLPLQRTTPIAKGDWVLFHAAAGGVGQIACQWARSEGKPYRHCRFG